MIDTILVKELIWLRSVADNYSDKQAALDLLIKKALPAINAGKLSLTRVSQARNPAVLLETSRANKEPEVMYYAHLDVVPGSDKQFEPIIDNVDGIKVLKGRGSLDMKAAAIMELELLLELVKRDNCPSLCFLLTTDEETGGFDGSKIVANNLGYRPKIVLMPDGGKNWHLVAEEKGVIWLQVTVIGKSAHSSRPWLGENACDVWQNYYNDCKKIYADKKIGHNRCVTINVGTILGGTVFNQVCPELKAGLDIRFPSTTNKQEILAALRELAASRNYKDKVTVTEKLSFAPSLTTPDHKEAEKFSSIACQVLGHDALKTEYSCGASDARWFTEKGVPVILMFPEGDGHHGDHEWVSLDGLETLRNIYRRFTLERA